MKKYRFATILLLFTLMLSLTPLSAGATDPVAEVEVEVVSSAVGTVENELDLFCRNAVLVDANHDEVLHDYRGYERAYPASMTKVMTALLTLEALEAGSISVDTLVTVSDTAARKNFPDESTANLKGGEQMLVRDLLYCLMLPSANDAAKALAEAVGGTMEDFILRMNQRAAELGCKDTHFVNPHGLHNVDHYTTAFDMALIFQAALDHPLFRELISTASYTVPPTNLSGERLFYNTNGLISSLYYSDHTYDKCIGGKTGSTDEAGRCLVAAAQDGDRLLISVIMGSGPMEVPGYNRPRQGQFDESKRLLEYGFNNFRRVTLSRPDEPVDKVTVTLSRQADEVMVKPQGSLTLTLPITVKEEDIQSKITLHSDTVQAPVEEGQVLGKMRLFYEDQEYGELDLVAVNAVERSELLYKKMVFLNFIDAHGFKLVLVGVLLMVLVAFVTSRRRRYRPSRRRRSSRSYRGSRR